MYYRPQIHIVDEGSGCFLNLFIERPALITFTGFRSATSRTADRNDMASPTDSMWSRMPSVIAKEDLGVIPAVT